MRKTAAKLAKRIKKLRSSKSVDLLAFKHAKQAVKDANETIADPDTLIKEGYNPVHALYVSAQNVLSSLVEFMLDMDELDRYHRIIGQAQEEYMPGGPPMSPVTNSFFYSWAFFDLAIGLQKETLTSITLDVSASIGLSEGLQTLLRHFDASRMGLYRHQGSENELTVLKELETGTVFHAFNPTGYRGITGELWFVRLLPGIQSNDKTHICFTTPYVLIRSGHDWKAFMDRRVWLKEKKSLSYEQFMKYGLNHHYWIEFVMQAYAGQETNGNAIYLQGVPDIATTRPHHSERHDPYLPEYGGKLLEF